MVRGGGSREGGIPAPGNAEVLPLTWHNNPAGFSKHVSPEVTFKPSRWLFFFCYNKGRKKPPTTKKEILCHKETRTFVGCLSQRVLQGVSIAPRAEPAEGGPPRCAPRVGVQGGTARPVGAQSRCPVAGPGFASLPGPAAATLLGHGRNVPAAALLCRKGKIRIFAGHGLCWALVFFHASLKIRCWIISSIYIQTYQTITLLFLHKSPLFQEKEIMININKPQTIKHKFKSTRSSRGEQPKGERNGNPPQRGTAAALRGREPTQRLASTGQIWNINTPGCGVTLFPAAFPLRGADAALRKGQHRVISICSSWECLSSHESCRFIPA